MPVLAKRTYKPADERREQILDCALQIFADKGYHGASIADVCARAGIGRGTLYQYFDDKRDVLVALADRLSRRVIDAIEARAPLVIPEGFVPTEDVALGVVTAQMVGILRVVFDDAASCRLILRAGRGADGVVDGLLRSIDEAVLGVMEADLETGQRAGILRPLDARFTARFFLGGVEKIVLSCIDEDRPIDVEAIARQVGELELVGALADRCRAASSRSSPPPSTKTVRAPRAGRADEPARSDKPKRGDRR